MDKVSVLQPRDRGFDHDSSYDTSTGLVHEADSGVKSLAPYRGWFESHQGLWILSCQEAIQLAFESSVALL